MQKPVYVGLETIQEPKGVIALEDIGWFDSVEEAEEFLATSATIDPARLEAGDYYIDAPDEMWASAYHNTEQPD